MRAAEDALAAIANLERCYDGPVPEPLRLIARQGSLAAAQRITAEAQAGFFRQLARGQLRAIRLRRAGASCDRALLADLALYRRQGRAWQRALRALDSQGEAVSPPSTVSVCPLT
jgi:hypothetical protein